MPTDPYVRSSNQFADMFRVDISNADVVFVNNVAFDESLNGKLLRKLHLNTRPGTVVVALADIPHINSQRLLLRRPNDPACFFTHKVIEAGDGFHEEERWVSWGSGRPRNYFVYQHIPAHVKATYVNTKLDPHDYHGANPQPASSHVGGRGQ